VFLIDAKSNSSCQLKQLLNISELDEGINPNPFSHVEYGQGHHIEALNLHPRSQERPPKAGSVPN